MKAIKNKKYRFHARPAKGPGRKMGKVTKRRRLGTNRHPV
jgi:hypothetical protein